jgi:hypothetical protein
MKTLYEKAPSKLSGLSHLCFFVAYFRARDKPQKVPAASSSKFIPLVETGFPE